MIKEIHTEGWNIIEKIILILILTTHFIWLRREQEKKVAKKPVNIEYVAPQSQTERI